MLLADEHSRLKLICLELPVPESRYADYWTNQIPQHAQNFDELRPLTISDQIPLMNRPPRRDLIEMGGS